MVDSASHSPVSISSPTVSSVLGIKGSLRFRRHGASQKAHVVLRRVELSEESGNGTGKSPVAYFSLFAQKRIEVKPGKEILLAVASEDGSFTDQAVIFEGDLLGSDIRTEAEQETQTNIEPVVDVPFVPPKMRRTWTKAIEQVSVVPDSAHRTPPPPERVSVGVQAQPSWAVSSVQAVPITSPVQIGRRIGRHISLAEFEKCLGLDTRSPEVAERPSAPQNLSLSPPLTVAIMDEDRERSLSPMSLGSPSSTPPQSPIIERIPNVFRVPSPVTEPPRSSQDSCMDLSSDSQDEKQIEDDLRHPGDTSSLPAEPSTPTSETADMDLQSSPSSASSSSSDIPGLVTGSSWRAPLPKTAPPPRPMEPGLEQETGSPPKLVIPSLPSVQPSVQPSLPERIPVFPKKSSPSAVPPAVNKPVTLPPRLTISVPKKPAIVNPFVSGGFMTEFVGSPASLTAQKSLPPKSRTGSPNMSEAQSTPTPISTPAPPRPNPPLQAPAFVPASCTVPTFLSPSAPSPQIPTKPPSPPLAVPTRPYAQEQRPTVAPLPPTPPSVPQPPRTQAYPSSLPPRPSETVIAYSNKAPYKPGYSPLTSASDARISYNATGTISNPLNIRPSRFAPLKATPIQSQQVPKKPLTIGNGWPHTRQANGNGSASISPVTSKALPPGGHRPLTPESTRSSTTPPGLTNFVSYTSPSPPGFLHRSLRDKPPTELSPSSSGEPNIKHEYMDIPLPPTPTTIVKQTISIQSPRPVLPASTTSPNIFRFSRQSNSATPPSDSKGKKRAISIAESDAESTRPRKRTHPWPTQESMYSTRIKSDSDAGVREIVFSSDGERMAVVCLDRTIRIWSVSNRVETARLAQNSPISSVAWMADDNGIITLGQDGTISKWTRNNQNHWQWAKLLDAGKEESISFTYNRDRLAVAFPRFGVKVWLWIKGTWQPQRSILRQNVTCIRFVEDGEALLGGTSDGVLWYCQVPNGTLRAYAFLKAKIRHLDVSPNGTQALVSQVGARAHLVGIQGMDRKGKIEQVYAMNGDSNDAKQSPPAVFVNGGRSVVFHSRDSSCLVWNKGKGEVLSGLDHGDNEQTQAVAGFDRASHSYIVTGTAQGLLSWWNSPPDQ